MRTGQRSGVSERSAPEWESDPLGGPSHPIAPSAPAAPPVLAGLPMGSATSRARASGGAGNADLPAAGRRFQRTIFSPDPDSRPYLQRHYDCFAVPTTEADMESPESSGTPHPAAQPMPQRSIFSPAPYTPYLAQHYACFAAPRAEADMVPPESSGMPPPVAGPLSRQMSEDGYELDTAAPHHALSEAMPRPSGQFRDSQLLSTNSLSRRDPTSSGSMRPHHTSSAPVMPDPAPPLETPRSVKPRAAYQSEVSGVRWNQESNRWVVHIPGRDDRPPQNVSFTLSRYGNDVDRARQAAERCAADIRAGTYVHQPRLRLDAPYLSAVPGVTWNKAQNRWQVRVKSDRGGKRSEVAFCAARYGNDVDRAREAAEQCAAEIRAGTYVRTSLTEYQSAMSGVTWHQGTKRWAVQVKGPGETKARYVSFSIARFEHNITLAREAAEKCAAEIQAGTYNRQSTR